MMRPHTGQRGSAAGPALVAALLVVVVAAGLVTAWLLLRSSPPRVDVPVATQSPEPRPEPEPVSAAPEAVVSPEEPITREVTTADRNALLTSREEGQRTLRDLVRPDLKGLKTYSFSGRVTDKLTGEPVMYFELSLIPASEGDVLQAAERWNAQKLRNPDGRFTLDYQLEGTYNLLVRSLTHEDRIVEGLTIPYSGEAEIALERGTWINGTVRDETGMLLEGMDVQLHPIKLDPGFLAPRRRLTKSDKRGYFEFTKLPPGTYSLTAGAIGDPDDEHPSFYLGKGQHLDKSFAIPRRTTVVVRVETGDGTAIPRARVQLIGENRTAQKSAYGDVKGAARLQFVRGGRYTLSIRAPSFLPLEEELFVSEGDPYLEVTRSLQPIQQ